MLFGKDGHLLNNVEPTNTTLTGRVCLTSIYLVFLFLLSDLNRQGPLTLPTQPHISLDSHTTSDNPLASLLAQP